MQAVLQSRAALAVGIVVALVVPATTLPRLPHVSPWPVLLGSLPWVVGRYVLCPLRWRALSLGLDGAPRRRTWYLRSGAESEVLGLLTPGHVGADLWRLKRLSQAGVARADALVSIGADRLVGALGLIAFIVFAAPDLDLSPALAYVAAGLGAAALLVGLVARRFRSRLLPSGPLPPPRALLLALALSAAYQLTIAGMLLGAINSTGHSLAPLTLLAAFGASQAAAALPGPNGASPRDGALVLALVALGVPLAAATAAVALKAALAWVPALGLGGTSFLLRRREAALAVA